MCGLCVLGVCFVCVSCVVCVCCGSVCAGGESKQVDHRYDLLLNPLSFLSAGVGLAAILSDHYKPPEVGVGAGANKPTLPPLHIGVILCGGNIDLTDFFDTLR